MKDYQLFEIAVFEKETNECLLDFNMHLAPGASEEMVKRHIISKLAVEITARFDIMVCDITNNMLDRNPSIDHSLGISESYNLIINTINNLITLKNTNCIIKNLSSFIEAIQENNEGKAMACAKTFISPIMWHEMRETIKNSLNK